MSRIGRKPISLPKGVTCTFSASDRKVTVKGPKGELKQVLEPEFKVTVSADSVEIARPTEQKRHKSQHGLYRALIANMVEGVSKGYRREMELIGVGYKHLLKATCLNSASGIHTACLLQSLVN